MKRTVLLFHTEPLAIQGFRSLFSGETSVLIETATGLGGGVTLAEACRPEVVIIDQGFGTCPVVEFIRTLRHALCDVPVVILVHSPVARDRLRFRTEGAHGIVCKTAPLSEISECIYTVLGGSTFFEGVCTPGNLAVGPPELSSRESEILRLIVRGYTNPQIAEKLDIAVGTVKNHIQHIFEKLGIRGRRGLTSKHLADADSQSSPGMRR